MVDTGSKWREREGWWTLEENGERERERERERWWTLGCEGASGGSCVLHGGLLTGGSRVC